MDYLTERVMQCDFPSDESFEYLSNRDRVGLTWPTDRLVNLVLQTITVFKVLVSSKYIKLFAETEKQRSVILELALQRCQKVVNLADKCAVCNKPTRDIAKVCIRIIANISLNNFTKQLADGAAKSKSLRKLSTLVK